MMSVVNEETIILEEVLGVLVDFKDLIANELSHDLPFMRDNHMKVFNVGDDVMIFMHKESFSVGTDKKLQQRKYDPFKESRKTTDNAYVVAFPYSINILNTFNVIDVHDYPVDMALYQEENSRPCSIEVGRVV